MGRRKGGDAAQLSITGRTCCQAYLSSAGLPSDGGKESAFQSWIFVCVSSPKKIASLNTLSEHTTENV